jgi:hypothetical protein
METSPARERPKMLPSLLLAASIQLAAAHGGHGEAEPGQS